jgi:glycosyltransferase involved in cell wall biosynthesis
MIRTKLSNDQAPLSNINSSIEAIDKEIAAKKQILNRLTSSKAYKVWQLYNIVKRIITGRQKDVDNSFSITNHAAGTEAAVEYKFDYVPADKDKYIQDLIESSAVKSPQYVSDDKISHNFTKDELKYIAFYLPQFHPFKENDEWWGKGFTEWTNVSKSVPQYVGHYQPHLPDELGFYDLRLPEIMERQIELAKQFGIYGFCFYYYWFSGKRLLEKPLDAFLKNKNLKQPFCLCWANENWSRRWDGLEQDVLMKQEYTETDRDEFVRDIKKYIVDERYIKIKEKPVLLVYRPGIIPDLKNTIKKWRSNFIKEGVGEVYLVAVKGFGFEDYKEAGFDMCVEYFPHNMPGCPDITHRFQYFSPEFSGNVFDYQQFVENKQYLKNEANPAFKCVSPGWDNSARKPKGGMVLQGANPDLYFNWLSSVSSFTKKHHSRDEQYVFINAWNEWAEGAHLEPDRKFGYGYLKATRDALEEKQNHKKIIFVSHDACLNGAQLISISIIKQLALNFKYEVAIILLSGGVLEKEFSKYGKVYNLQKDFNEANSTKNLILDLKYLGFKKAICNTTVSGNMAKKLSDEDIEVISLIHEMPVLIKKLNLESAAKNALTSSKKIIFPSKYVESSFFAKVIHKKISPKSIVRPQGLYKINDCQDNIEATRKKIRSDFHLSPDSKIVLGVGFADHRKGFDLFVETAIKVTRSASNVFFIWVGDMEAELFSTVKSKVVNNKNIITVKSTLDISAYYAAADIYLLTSREDPFPSVVLEAFEVGVPVIGFKDAGGFSDIVTDNTGALVDYENTDQLSRCIKELLSSPEKLSALSLNCKQLIKDKFNFVDYIYDLVKFLGDDYKKVSVIIPNYNYAQYLPLRINSVLNQTYPLREVIILDDKSTDNSVEVIESFKKINNNLISTFYNGENSGSVFRQWSKGIKLSKGDFVWIAEADDYSDTKFVEKLLPGFDKNKVVLSYCQSKQVDENGSLIANDYLEYTKDIDPKKWKNDYFNNGLDEIKTALSIKNTIPNVSAVIFKKFDIEKILKDLVTFKVVGDQYMYIHLLEYGDIYFNHIPLNYHRRHLHSVTISQKNNLKHFQEIVTMQEYVQNHFQIDDATKSKVTKYREYVKKYLNA